VQPSRLAIGLVPIPLLIFLLFLLAGQPHPAAAFQGSPDSATNKKKVTDSKSKSVAASAGQSAAKTTAKTTSPKASLGTAKKSTAARKRSSRSGSKAASRKTPRQQQPEPERIREIQQALKQHGYAVEASGVWDASTVEAVKKFQADQNIENLSGRGKLDSLTLIALGLGPKREPPPGSSEAPQRSQEGHFP
jgi:peptidoglycan hydrolase-like protein with peptidoglycan-binding domain